MWWWKIEWIVIKGVILTVNVFQMVLLMPSMSLLQNTGYGLNFSASVYKSIEFSENKKTCHVMKYVLNNKLV